MLSCMRRVTRAIKNELSALLIQWPTGRRAQEVMEGFSVMKGFPRVLGAIDGCHIPMKAPNFCPENYINRKGFHSVILQEICDDKMMFTDCYVGWPGAVHDARVFRNFDIFANIAANKDTLFPGDSHLLGDAAYPLDSYLMTPFKHSGFLTRDQKRYNYKHSATRSIIERVFALLKGRFPRLKYVDLKKIDDVSMLVIVSCTLHNFCLQEDNDYEQFMDQQEEEVNDFQNILPEEVRAEDRRSQ